MNPVVSIVISCFNHGQYLADAVQSVLRQTYSDVQVIVVDDGSTDETAEVSRAFGSAITYVRQKNRGLSAARNAGIKIAKGSFIGLLDADDCFYPIKVEKQLKLLLENPQLGLVYCGWALVRDGDFVVLKTEIPNDKHNFVDELLTHSVFHVLCPLLRREVVELTGFFDENLTSCEDRDYWLRAARDGVGVGCVAEPLAWVRVRDDSMNTDVGRMHENSLAVFEKHCEVLTDKTILLGKRGRIHFQACVQYMRQGAYREAATCLEQALLDKDDILERCSTWQSAFIGMAGDTYQRRVELSSAELALFSLSQLAPPYVSVSKRKRQAFFGLMSLGRLAVQCGNDSACRRAYLKAAIMALQSPVPFGRMREVLSGLVFGISRKKVGKEETPENGEICLPPGRNRGSSELF